jgi:hypothetical protein
LPRGEAQAELPASEASDTVLWVKRALAQALCLTLLGGCALRHAPQAPLAGGPAPPEAAANASREEILESGGELPLEACTGPTLVVGAREVVALGTIEAPGDSRLQAALAAADAVARAELSKALEVSIQSLEVDLQNEGGVAAVERLQRETTRAALGGLGLPQRGWLRLRRGRETILRVCSELRLTRESLVEALAQRLEADKHLASRLIDRLAPQKP